MRIKALLLATLLGGCTAVVVPSPESNSPVDAGAPPTAYVENIRMWILAQLKNRDSLAQFEVSRPEFGTCFIDQTNTFHGWRVPVTYSIRRSQGGNSGVRTLYAWFNGESLRRVSNERDRCPAVPVDPG